MDMRRPAGRWEDEEVWTTSVGSIVVYVKEGETPILYDANGRPLIRNRRIGFVKDGGVLQYEWTTGRHTR